jgi:hypothetical protein
MVSAARAVAGFDSASAMARILGSALHGRDAPLLAQFPGRLEPAVDWLAGRLERLPVPVVQAVYRRAGWADAITASRLRRVRSERLADWVVRHYPRRRYPVVFIGSSNGAMAHLAAALGAPWLPQTLLLAVRHGGLDPDDPAADMQAMRPAGRVLVESNPDLALHHMHDPVQDRLMIARMTYFRVKFLRLPGPYRAFLDSCLAPGGTVVLVDCTLSWPTTTVGDRHVFQFGAPGGVTGREFREGSPRVAQFLRQQGSGRDRWWPPAADGTSPEAEWGFAEPLAEDVAALAADRGARLERLRFEEPEDLSPLIAELFRDWYAELGLPDGRLLVSSFLLMDPMLAMRTGSVPYWALFGTQPSLDRLAGYLSRAAGYDDIRLTIFPHGVESIGLPGIGEWQAVLGCARRNGQLLALEPGRYPRHFRTLTGFHRELNRLPHVPASPPLGWDAARQYLAPHAAAHNVTFG